MSLVIRKYCAIRDGRIRVDGEAVFSYEGQDGFKKFIRTAYKHFQTDYPKFFKMDNLSKLGFLSVEILLKGEDILKLHPAEKTGIILTNASSSLEIDEKHFESIKDRGQYFPSPSNFVYTLPNIMAGEAAIRHKIKGENTVLINKYFDPELIFILVELAFKSKSLSCCICGWVEQYENNYESLLFMVEKDNNNSAEDIIFEPSNLANIYKRNNEDGRINTKA
ncbi:MAG: 3-oxoacyl-ACP synthase [Bacteroidetes bacterium]|nr:3-oxoacyl-ACP synthase [Bacteroidota bacterium]